VFHARFNRYVAVALAALLGASCSDGSTAPRPAATSEHDRALTTARAHSYIARGEIVKRTGNLQEDISATATITPEGGSLSLPEAGLVLFFPRDAVSETIEVTATALKGKRLVYDFQPHGLVFNTPIYVAQQLRGTELNAQRTQKKGLDVWAGYLSRGTDDILADGSANFTETFDATYYGTGSETLAVFMTTHFSGYAMASGRRETPGLPGLPGL
jgi:hypothetical protein